MVAKIEKILECCLALLSSGAKFVQKKWQIWLFLGVCLVFALLVWLSSCTSNHYFSINAEEMTNPSIEYKDSTHLTIPFQ